LSTCTIDKETKINHELEKLQGWSKNGLLHSIPPKLNCYISNSENGSDINLRFNNRRLEVSTVHMD